MYIKIHRSYRNVVAVCDAELIGKILEEGEKQLDCRENFYKDKLVTKEEAVKIMRAQAADDATFNIVGKKATAAAVEAGLIEEKSIAIVAKTPLVLIF